MPAGVSKDLRPGAGPWSRCEPGAPSGARCEARCDLGFRHPGIGPGFQSGTGRVPGSY